MLGGANAQSVRAALYSFAAFVACLACFLGRGRNTGRVGPEVALQPCFLVVPLAARVPCLSGVQPLALPV